MSRPQITHLPVSVGGAVDTSSTLTAPQFRYQLLVEEYDIARQLASLAAVNTAVERAHIDGRLNATEYERRRREIFARRVELEHREKELRDIIDRAQPRLGPQNAESLTLDEEKALLVDELAYLSQPVSGSARPQLEQLLRDSSMAARLADILARQRRLARDAIGRARRIENDAKLSQTRRQSAGARRKRLEMFVATELLLEEERLHQQRLQLQQLIRQRSTRQGVFMPLQHYTYDLGDILEQQQVVGAPTTPTLNEASQSSRSSAGDDDEDDENR